jgi:nucleoside-diphosphate-sugar epimerase
MRALVIGGNGFIGTPLVRELLNDGHDVAVFHRGAEVSSNQKPLQIRGHRNRLPDYEDELRRFAPEVIIDMVLCSGEQARQLIAVADKINARVIAISSMDVYRAWGVVHGSEPGGLEPMPITEDAPLRTARQVYPPEVVEKMKKSSPGWARATTKSQLNRRSRAVSETPLFGCRWYMAQEIRCTGCMAY